MTWVLSIFSASVVLQLIYLRRDQSSMADSILTMLKWEREMRSRISELEKQVLIYEKEEDTDG